MENDGVFLKQKNLFTMRGIWMLFNSTQISLAILAVKMWSLEITITLLEFQPPVLYVFRKMLQAIGCVFNVQYGDACLASKRALICEWSLFFAFFSLAKLLVCTLHYSGSLSSCFTLFCLPFDSTHAQNMALHQTVA